MVGGNIGDLLLFGVNVELANIKLRFAIVGEAKGKRA